MKKSKLYSLKEGTIAKINSLSVNMGVCRGEFVDVAVGQFEDSLDIREAKLLSKKDVKMQEVLLIDEELVEVERLKEVEQSITTLLNERKKTFKDNVKRLFDEGRELEGIAVANRVSYLVKCDYRDLLPV